MKTRLPIYVLSSIFLVLVLLLVLQRLHKPTPEEPGKPPYLVLDRKTWKIADPKTRAADLKKYNTQEAKEQRRKAVQSFESPEEYRKQFPTTVEQQTREEAARRLITNPPTLEEALRAKTPEERKAFEESLEGMLKPRVDTPAK